MAISASKTSGQPQLLKELKVLLVDSDEHLSWMIDSELRAQGAEVMRAGSIREALDRVLQVPPDVAIVDLYQPDGNGLELLKKWRFEHPELTVILATAQGTMASAVAALRLGASDFLQKPLDLRELVAAVGRAGETTGNRRNVSGFQGREASATEVEIIGETAAMVTLRDELHRVAASKAWTALVLGESGTGKELAARAVHEWGDRRGQPFVEINCASIPEALLESELFGYEKGAFTDARERKLGLFEIARHGSIFLDEIGEMPLKLQAKLLRSLEYRRFKRLGGTKDIEFNARVICATNRDLLVEAAEKRFRADLYYRLSALPVYVPALAERTADIGLLAEFFLGKLAEELQLTRPTLAPESLRKLISHPWPGNVRELRNVLQRAMVFHSVDVILPGHIRLDRVPEAAAPAPAQAPVVERARPAPPSERAPSPPLRAPNDTLASNDDEMPLVIKKPSSSSKSHEEAVLAPVAAFELPVNGLDLEVLERDLLLQALERASHNQTRAAQLLGITRHTLRYRLEKHGLLNPGLGKTSA